MGFGFSRQGVVKQDGSALSRVQGTLSLGVSSVTFTTSEPSATSTAIVLIDNAAYGRLDGPKVGTITYDNGDAWCTASVANEIVFITVNGTGMGAGDYVCHIPITDANATNSPQTIDVTLTVLPPAETPVIVLAPGSLIFAGTESGSATTAQTVVITNGGGVAFSGLAVGTITYSSGSGWITATLASDGGSLSVTANPATLAAGTFTATIPIEASNATTQNIDVTFVVSAAAVPQLSLSKSTVAFSATTGGNPTATQTITVNNTGSGSIAGLAVGSITYGSGSGWLSATLSGTTITVQASPGQLAAGNYSATFPVTSSNASNSPQTVSVAFALSQATNPAQITLSPSALTFNATASGSNPITQTIAITNGGTETLAGLTTGSVTYGSGSGWLTTKTITQNSTNVAIDATSASSGTGAGPWTWNHTNNGSVLFFAGGGLVASARQFSRVTYNGIDLTLIQRSTSSSPRQEVWCLVNPPIGTYQFSVSINGSIVNTVTLAGISYSGFDTTITEAALAAASAKAAGESTSPSVTVASETGGLVFGSIINSTYSGTPATLTWANESERLNATFGSGEVARVSLADEAGAASVVISGTLSASAKWSAVAVPLSPASSGSGVATLTVGVTTGALAAGTYSATFPVTATNASNSPQTVSVTFTVASTAPASLVLSQTSKTFNATVGGGNPANQTIAITNGGVQALAGPATGAVTYGSGAGWLTTKTVSGSDSPYTLTIGVTTGALAAGTYTATFPVTDANATNSPRTVTVSFTVAAPTPPGNYPPPTYTLPSWLTFDASTDILSGEPFASVDPATYFTGTVRTYDSQATFNTAMAASVDGDIVEQAAGTTVTWGSSASTIPAKAAGWVWWRSSGHASLPAAGTRIDPTADAAALATIAASSVAALVQCAQGRIGLYVSGINFTKTSATPNNGASMVDLRATTQTALAHVPTHIEFRHCCIRNPWQLGGPYSNHGLRISGQYVKIRDCYIDGHTSRGFEAQAVLVDSTPGDIEIHNCFIEGGSINLLCGGVTNSVGYTNAPIRNVWVHQNYFFKRTDWLSGGIGEIDCVSKNLFELKAGEQWVIEGNVFENHDGRVQPHNINMGAKAQSTAEAGLIFVKDILFRNNLIQGGASPIQTHSIDSYPGVYTTDGTQRMEIANNLFHDQRFFNASNNIQIGYARGYPDLLIHHNTFQALRHNILFFNSNNVGRTPNFTYRDNICFGAPSYGPIWKAEGGSSNTAALDIACGTGLWTVKNNVVLSTNWDANLTANHNNKRLATLAEFGFVDSANGDYTIASNSTIKGIGTGGSDPGVNMSRLNAAIDGVVIGVPTES